MEYAIRLNEVGIPDVTEWAEIPTPDPGPGEVLAPRGGRGELCRSAAAVRPISGTAAERVGPGRGRLIERLGPGVTTFKLGDRVVYIAGTPGSYSTVRCVPVACVVAIPAGLDTVAVASMFTRGLPAWHLTHTVRDIGDGDDVVVQTAGGGVGGLIAQFAKRKGARVIGVVATPQEAQLAKEAGCLDVLISGPTQAFNVRELTGGLGASVVYDPIGQATFDLSLDCLRPRGLTVAFGNLSDPIPPIAPMAALGRRGSLQLAWPMLSDFMTPDLIRSAVRGLFEAMEAGLALPLGQTFPIAAAGQAHRLIEQRSQRGATVLTP